MFVEAPPPETPAAWAELGVPGQQQILKCVLSCRPQHVGRGQTEQRAV